MRKELRYIILVFLLGVIPKLVIAVQMVPYLVYDEGGSMAFAAYLAGKDWSNVLSSGSAYYGFGFYSWMALYFKITDDPYLIYRLICITDAVIQAFCGIICYFIVSRFLNKKESYIENSLVSVLCSYLVVVRVQCYNENGLILIAWLTTLLLCLIVNEVNQKKKSIYSCLIWIIAVYGLTIHTRAIILVVALICTALLYRILYKENLFSKISYFLVLIGFALSKFLIKCVQQLLWHTGDGTIHNASIDVGSHLGNFNFGDINAWKAILITTIGQISALNLFSGGLLIISLCLVIVCLLNKWKESTPQIKCIFVISLTFLICFAGMIGGLTITWGDGVYEAISQGLKNQDVYKALTYVRYAGAYMAPLIMCGLIELLSRQSKNRSYIFGIAIISIVTHAYWIKNIVPWIENCLNAFEVFIPFAFRKPREGININMYMLVTVWFIILINCFVILAIKNRKKIYLCIITAFLCFEFLYTGYYNDVFYCKDHSMMAINSYEVLQELSAKDSDFEFDKIYMYNGDFIREQFYFNNKTIVKDVPRNEENAILLYEGDLNNSDFNDAINIEEYVVLDLSNNQYILIKGKDYVESVTKSGIPTKKGMDMIGVG